MEPVPEGVAGELYIGGDGLARGYLTRGALTAERFVPDPFSSEPGARLYKTGDLGRSRRDGRVEFLGRGDHQVKLRGYRIELGEVEAALAGVEGVAAAAAVMREDEPGRKQLGAYVVPSRGTAEAEEVQTGDGLGVVGAWRGGLAAEPPDYQGPAPL